jgi:integrase/recombinase XerD
MKRISLGKSIPEEHWNPEKSEVRKSNSQYRQINTLIRAKILELERAYLEQSIMNRPATADSLLSKLKREITGENFIDYAKIRIEKMVSPWTRKSQTSVIKKLDEYVGTKGLFFLEINYEFLVNYERHLKKQKNGVNTIHANMKTIKAIYNEAFNSGYFVPEKGSPWILYKPKKAKSTRAKLSETQITDIEKLELNPGTNEWHSKNIFLLSFYLQGMRTSDIMQLQWSQIKDDRVEYTAGKTEKFRSKKLIVRAKEILRQYYYPGLRPTDYVFPFLRSSNKTKLSGDAWIKIIGSKNALINGHLQTIAKKIGVKKISMHVARHSFADIANRKTGDVHKVSDALGHSSVSVTENYLRAASRSENDDLVNSVYGE